MISLALALATAVHSPLELAAEKAGMRVVVLEPAAIELKAVIGWDPEARAVREPDCVAAFTGPFFDGNPLRDGRVMAIGDLYLAGKLWPASRVSRPFAERRYHMALTRSGVLQFGYGGWEAGDESHYESFVGGLGVFFSPSGRAAPGYLDPYRTSEAQRIQGLKPRERLAVGMDAGGRLVVVKTRPLTVREAAIGLKKLGLVEAYYMDQGTKARLLVPGQILERSRGNLPYLLVAVSRLPGVSSSSVR